MSYVPDIFGLIPKNYQRLLIVVLASAGLACCMASIAWIGCASSAGSSGSSPPSIPAAAWQPPQRFSFAPRNLRFKDNIIFLKEANLPVPEVYASLGPPDWESKELRLIAYKAQNNQALFVTYGTNNLVSRHAVKKLTASEVLAEAASLWLRSN